MKDQKETTVAAVHIKAVKNPSCVDKVDNIDYKDVAKLRRFVLKEQKFYLRRVTGTCAHHQRELTVAIKRARIISLLPFSSD